MTGVEYGTCDMRRRKKLIETGWDMTDNHTIGDLVAGMEQLPFDGVVLKVRGVKPDGKRIELRMAFESGAWEKAWFADARRQLKAVPFVKFTDNFILLNALPGVDWFDGEGWKDTVDHCRIAAWLAKGAGFKGIVFDPESYSADLKQFRYWPQPEFDWPDFAETCGKARQRGAELMDAIADVYPDITLLCYFMNSQIGRTATGCADPRPGLQAYGWGYELLAPFIDGWLDAAPPTVTIVDGCERAYLYQSEHEYMEMHALIKGACQDLVSPENRAKYRAQVQVGYGVYMDAYVNEPPSKYIIPPLRGSRVERLRANVGAALHLADEYVWIYGEKYRWWPEWPEPPRPGTCDKSWPEALPGCDQVLAYVRDPIGYAREWIAAQSPDNLLQNGDFAEGQEGGLPLDWFTSPRGDPAFAWDGDTWPTGPCARVRGMGYGDFGQNFRVEAGERYAVRAMCRLQGYGSAYLRIRWQAEKTPPPNPTYEFVHERRDPLFFCPGPRDQWTEMFGVFQVPDGVDRIQVQLTVRDQRDKCDVAWFDDARLYRLP